MESSAEIKREKSHRRYKAKQWQMMREFRIELFKALGLELPDAENPYLDEQEGKK